MSITTANIYQFHPDGELIPRSGAIRLADDEVVLSSRDAERAIYVKGLHPGDFAVFLCITPE